MTVPKNIKVNSPDPYNGENDHQKFETFLFSLLDTFVISNLCGDQCDRQRIIILGNCLKGEAEVFFREQVSRPMFMFGGDWTFSKAVCSLYVRAGGSCGAPRYDGVGGASCVARPSA